MASNSFNKRDCELCQRTTWHRTVRRPNGDEHTYCLDHSEYVKGRRHVIVKDAVSGLHDIQKPSELELRIANRLDRTMWNVAELKRASTVDVSNEDWVDALFADEKQQPTRDPNKMYCSFCHSEIDKVNTLSERKAVIKRIEEPYRNSAGEIAFQEKIVSKVEDFHACPNCVLQVRNPIVVRRV